MRLKQLLTYIGLIACCAIILFPIYWAVSTSFKLPKDVFASPPIYWPSSGTLANYREVIARYLTPAIPNSAVVSLSSTALALLVGSAGGYALSRFPSKRRGSLAMWILSTRMMPPIATAIPLFLMLNAVNLLDTRLGLILAYVAFNLPFVVWVTKGFFDEIPVEVEESALLDGCTPLGVFWRLAIPMALPGIVAAGILGLIFSWNEFLFALVLTRSSATTLPVVMSSLESTDGIYWGHIGALSTIAIVPVLILAAFIQRYLVRGMTMGAVKG